MTKRFVAAAFGVLLAAAPMASFAATAGTGVSPQATTATQHRAHTTRHVTKAHATRAAKPTATKAAPAKPEWKDGQCNRDTSGNGCWLHQPTQNGNG